MTLADLPNLGPTTARMLREVGVETPDDLRETGAPRAFLRLRHRYGRRVSPVALWALAGALEGRHWLSFSPSEKAALDAASSVDSGAG